MKRGTKPLRTRSNLQASKGLARKPLAPMSKKRKAEAPERARVRAVVIARDGGCRAAVLLPGRCRSPFRDRPPLEVHEVESRARRPGSHLDPDLCVALCQFHHDMVTEDRDGIATKAGLLRSNSTGVDNSQGTP